MLESERIGTVVGLEVGSKECESLPEGLGFLKNLVTSRSLFLF